MNISKKKKLLTAQLNENFEALEKSLDVLNYSFRIGLLVNFKHPQGRYQKYGAWFKRINLQL